MGVQSATMKDLDAVNNQYFHAAKAAAAFEAQLNFFWQLTSRVGMSISESDLDEIKQTHERVAAAVDSAFESMLEVATERRKNLARYSAIAFVSVGEGCLSRAVLTRWGMKPPRSLGELSGPFDLAVHPVSATVALLESDFAGWIDPNRLSFSEEHGYVVNPDLGVSFNHEVGEEYNEPGSFRKIRSIYERRLTNFRNVLNEAPNTWEAGQEIQTDEREPIADQNIRVVDIHYPSPGYRWWLDFSSEAGHGFERELITEARSFVDAWRGFSPPG
jgi:hypothetical protein